MEIFHTIHIVLSLQIGVGGGRRNLPFFTMNLGRGGKLSFFPESFASYVKFTS